MRLSYLIVTIEAVDCQFGSMLEHSLCAYIRTIEAAIDIHTVSLSPDPPRYLRGMVRDKI